MGFTTEAIEVAAIANPTGPKEFDLPTKEFIGYDPKGQTDITGSPIKRPAPQDVQQENTTETVAEPPVQEESVRLSPRLTALARKEQVQRRREQALVQRERALEARLADAEKYSQLKGKIAAKDYSAADELGLTYEEYTQYLLKKQNDTNPEEQRYRQVEEKLSILQKAQEEQTVKDYQQNQALWKAEIAKVVSENPLFSTIKELGAEGAVLQHVNDSFDEDGVELSVEEAAQQIEDELFKRAEKFSTVSKLKAKGEAPKALGAPKTSTNTITQNMTVTSKAPSRKPMHLLSESEQWAEATRRVQEERLARSQGR
jgi:hypothetical protein